LRALVARPGWGRRVAVLSDIHGVLPALESVLSEPEVASADRVVLTGDLAAGPHPRETLDLLASLGERAVWIRGNADRELVQLARGEVGTVPDPIAPWAAAQLRADQVELLAGLPLTATLEVAGLGKVLFCHATPRSEEEILTPESPRDCWAAALAGKVYGAHSGHTASESHPDDVRLRVIADHVRTGLMLIGEP